MHAASKWTVIRRAAIGRTDLHLAAVTVSLPCYKIQILPQNSIVIYHYFYGVKSFIGGYLFDSFLTSANSLTATARSANIDEKLS